MEQLLSKIDELIKFLKKSKGRKTVSGRFFLSSLKEFCEAWKADESLIFGIKRTKEKEKEITGIVESLWRISGKEKQNIGNIRKKLRLLKKFLYEEVIPNVSQPSIHGGNWKLILFEEKSDFSAYKYLKSILQKAKRNISITDGYIDEDTLDYLNISKKVIIRILTNNIYGNFKRDYKKFRKEYNVEVRINEKIHDRFVIVDNHAFICGTSLHRVGSKATAIVFLPAGESKKIIEFFKKEWGRSKKFK